MSQEKSLQELRDAVARADGLAEYLAATSAFAATAFRELGRAFERFDIKREVK